MKLILISLLAMVMCGCAQMIKWDQSMYQSHKDLAIQRVTTWSFNSGYFTCALGGTQITFPATLKNAAELQALFQNPVFLLGIAQQDEIAKAEGEWNESDYRLGCFQGTTSKMAASELIAALRAFCPQCVPYLPAFGQ